MKKDIKISVPNLIFGLYIYASIVAQRSLLGYVTLVIFILYSFYISIIRKKLKISLYFVLEIIFILYCMWQNNSGISLNQSASEAQVKTLIIGTIFNIALYNFIMYKRNIRYVLKTYIFANFFGLLTLLVLYFHTVLQGRFTAQNSIYLLGINIGGHSATSISIIAGQAFFLTVLLYWKSIKEKRQCILYLIFFIVIILLTGTRKTLLLVLGSLIFVTGFKSNTQNILKILRNIMIGIIIALLGYVIIMNVDFLYEVLGSRIESMIDYAINGEINESSISSRVKFIDIALEHFYANPSFGCGLDSFKTVINPEGLYSHNNFVEILVSTGIVGFIIYYSKYVVLAIKLISIKKKSFLKDKIYINSFIVYFIILVILEIWQITFIYRTCMISYILILGYIEEVS